tara:strand:+ start:351 stop:494 length:144 start_codon:yes stop_codon:yes gene_type:complete
MLTDIDNNIESIGIEPLEVLGFSTEQELEDALIPLMEEIKPEGIIAA